MGLNKPWDWRSGYNARTIVSFAIEGDGTVHMHRHCTGTFSETLKDLATVISSIKSEMNGKELCPEFQRMRLTQKTEE